MKSIVKSLTVAATAVSLVAGAFAGTLDIGDIQCGYIVPSGWVITGTLKSPYSIAIQDGTTVTISNMVVNLDEPNYAYPLPGLTCTGDATIILKGTNIVKSIRANYPGIFVSEGKTLTIKGDGSLTAIGKDYAAAIGGGTNAPCGNIVIESGVVDATGGYMAAGIGTGQKGTCGDITINGGKVTATGGYTGAAIGGGASGTCGDITINGGKVTANGSSCAPGIGSGNDATYGIGNSCGNITINGGVVKSTGGTYSAGIGSGRSSQCGNIYIGPGIIMVKATAGEWGQPIGNGYDAVCGIVTVDKSLHSSTEDRTHTIRSNTIDLSTVEENMTIDDGYTLTGELASKCKLSIAPDSTVTLSNAVINGESTNLKEHQWAGLSCLGETHLVLVGDNVVRGFDYGYPGIHVPTNATLYILGGGSLAASSNGGAAGIGGGIGQPCGLIYIASGTIDAIGSSAPGIGGDVCEGVHIIGGKVMARGGTWHPGIGGANCSGVVVEGGDVTAYGGSNAAGIGGSNMSDCACEIWIMGGNVAAYGGKNGAGIGSGCEGKCGQILFYGGNIVAVGGAGACGIGFGAYGSCGQIYFIKRHGFGAEDFKLAVATCSEGGTPIAAGDYGSPEDPIVDAGFSDDHGYPTRTIKPAPLRIWTLTYHSNNGKNDLDSQNFMVGEEKRLYYMNSRLGWEYKDEGGFNYVFLGWAKSPTGAVAYENGALVKDLAESGKVMHIYAVWQKRAYNVCFHSNYDRDFVEYQEFRPNIAKNLLWLDSGLGWTRFGYDFKGWAKAPTSTAVVYANGQTVNNLVAQGKTLHLYAVWRDRRWTIRFHRNYNSNDNTYEDQKIPVGASVKLRYLDSQLGWTRDGYWFKGWAKSRTAGAVYQNGQTVKDLVGPGEVLHLYGAWGQKVK